MTRTLGAADIGSNTAHLLIAASDGNLLTRIDNCNEWIPLGEVVSREGRIPGEIADQLVMAIKEFRRIANARNVEKLYVFATEGMRMASNHAEVLARIKEEAGIRVEVISPRREAELSVRSIQLDSAHMDPTMLFEVGGGSVQVGQIEFGHLRGEQSLPLGTGRVIAAAGLRNPCPPELERAARQYIEATLANCVLEYRGGAVVASGGVGRGLWRALHPDGDKRIAIEELEYLAWSAARLPIDRIVSRFGVKAKRAGTLLPGALIYRALMLRFGVREMWVSEFGVREGAILQLARSARGRR